MEVSSGSPPIRGNAGIKETKDARTSKDSDFFRHREMILLVTGSEGSRRRRRQFCAEGDEEHVHPNEDVRRFGAVSAYEECLELEVEL